MRWKLLSSLIGYSAIGFSAIFSISCMERRFYALSLLWNPSSVP